MRKVSQIHSLTFASMAVLLAVGGSVAFAQESPVKPSPAQSGADPSMAKPEGSSIPALDKPQASNPESTVGLAPADQPVNNWKQNVAGQVVPSSHDTAAYQESIFQHDQQPTLTHSFNFTAEQRRAIVDALAQDKDSSEKAPFEITETIVLPASTKLKPLPESIVAEMPWMKPYRYVKFGEKIAIVDPNLHYVAAIIE